jgi:CheY-like chemotaxis protein
LPHWCGWRFDNNVLAHLSCVILIDLMMPHMNGWDFPQVRQHDPVLVPNPIVVILTARGSAPAAALGVQETLDKPIDMDRLVDLVQQYCPGVSPS